MSDIIRREDAIDAVIRECEPICDAYDNVVTEINSLPSAEAVQGKWETAYLDHEAMGERPSVIYCSRCNHCFAYKTNFCPNCGARMEVRKNDKR